MIIENYPELDWDKFGSDIAVALIDFMQGANLTPQEIRYTLLEGVRVIKLRTKPKKETKLWMTRRN